MPDGNISKFRRPYVPVFLIGNMLMDKFNVAVPLKQTQLLFYSTWE